MAVDVLRQHFELDVQQFFGIEGSCRNRPALKELDAQQFFVVEGSCRNRPALEELDPRRALLRRAGSTAKTTPPFLTRPARR